MSIEAVVNLTATGLSALGLIAIAVSLLLQVRQTKILQTQAVMTHQLELLRLAYENPDLQEGWSRSVDLPYDQWRRRTYMNLIFMYLRMGYKIGEFTDQSLERNLTNRFRTHAGRAYWSSASRAFRIGARTRADRRFYEMAQSIYEDSLRQPPLGDDEQSPQTSP